MLYGMGVEPFIFGSHNEVQHVRAEHGRRVCCAFFVPPNINRSGFLPTLDERSNHRRINV